MLSPNPLAEPCSEFPLEAIVGVDSFRLAFASPFLELIAVPVEVAVGVVAGVAAVGAGIGKDEAELLLPGLVRCCQRCRLGDGCDERAGTRRKDRRASRPGW